MSIMPLPKSKKAPRKRWGRRRGARKGAAVALPKRTTGNFASATEIFSLAVTAGQVYDFTFKMSDLIRTQALMNVYQYYRITSVEMRFKPYSDTFAPAAGASIPYLNFQYDKSGALAGLTGAGFEEIGTKPARFDDKTLIRKWKPSVLISDTGIQTGIVQFKVSPWLPTYVGTALNNDIIHHGAAFYISKMNPSDGTVYDVDVVVNVQYRKPLITPSSSVENPQPVRIKQGELTTVDLSLNPLLQG